MERNIKIAILAKCALSNTLNIPNIINTTYLHVKEKFPNLGNIPKFEKTIKLYKKTLSQFNTKKLHKYGYHYKDLSRKETIKKLEEFAQNYLIRIMKYESTNPRRFIRTYKKIQKRISKTE